MHFFNNDELANLKKYLYYSYIHDSKVQSVDYDAETRILKISSFNPIYNVKIDFIFKEQKLSKGIYMQVVQENGIPWWLRQNRICLQCRRHRFDPWVGKYPWRRKWQPTPLFLPGESLGQRSLTGYSPWGPKELDTTEQLHFHLYRKT